MVAGENVPDVVAVTHASAEPCIRMHVFDSGLTLAADFGQALRREAFAADEIAIGRADRSGRQAVEPRLIHQPWRELDALVGDAAARLRFEQAAIVLHARAAV